MADNFTFKDASGVNRTARAKDNSSIHLPATVLADELGNLIPADDAAAAGPIFPVAGVYQSTVDEVDAGDIGRIRMSARRAVLTGSDFATSRANHTAITGLADIEVSTTAIGGPYVAATIDWFDGSDSAFGAGNRWVRWPMKNFNECNFIFQNNLGVNVTLSVYLWFSGFNAMVIYSQSALTPASYFFTPRDIGTGGTAAAKVIPAMLNPTEYFVIGVTPASDPSSGNIGLWVNRK